MFWFFHRLSLSHHSLSFVVSVSVWMSVAAGKRYLEEAKLKAQEGQRVRTEARLVQLKLIQLESRIVELESLTDHFKNKPSFRCLPFVSTLLTTSFFLSLFLVAAYYIFTSPFQATTL
jgi:hypothetical protein